MSRDVAALFATRPWQWGLRGDPHLWAALERHFAGVPVPDDAQALRTLIEAAFAELAGFPLDDPRREVFVQAYAHGGMSSGYVFLPFWRGTALPMLLAAAGFAPGPPPGADPP
ncbi:hypothetical protein [Arenimonas composti]|uniref:MobA protein n=1 Tax=Arenimonas composti TR7-09 = DSM 18010 TaxID=1121013 RepID=A0A091C3Y9_9GAMM|nr:hypothetical protein [Arenimonas composti]KFN51365.1 hypothetical protein P873_03610 [Arenimonas composti TR7-09 = DSM 18010]